MSPQDFIAKTIDKQLADHGVDPFRAADQVNKAIKEWEAGNLSLYGNKTSKLIEYFVKQGKKRK